MSTEEEILESAVTIVVIAYNHEESISKALDAAFSQSYQQCSVIVIDDASPDGTAEIVRDYLRREERSAIFLHHEVNRGLCATLNEALTHVTGDYVVFISADDWMEPNRIEEQVKTLDSLGEAYGAAYSDANIVDVNGQSSGDTFIHKYLGEVAPPRGEIFLDLLRKNWIPAPAVLIRTTVFAKVGGYDEKLPFEDYDMWLRIARRFKIAYTPGNLVNYRNVPGSLSDVVFVDNAPTARLAKIRMYKKHLYVNDEADHIIAGHLEHLTISQYLAGAPVSDVQTDLRFIFRNKPSRTILAYLLLTLMRVPGHWTAFIKARLGTSRPKNVSRRTVQ